jgi:PAS domain S-box-containing protein
MADEAGDARGAPVSAERGSPTGVTEHTGSALERLSRLQVVTAALSEATTPRQVAAVVLDQGIAALEARAGAVCLLDPSGTEVVTLASSGYTHADRPFQRVSVAAPLAGSEVMRTGEAVYLHDHAAVAAHYPNLPSPTIKGALAVVPLSVGGRVLGAWILRFDGPRDFDASERELLTALATQGAQALERARLYELALGTQEDLRRSRDQLAAILHGIAEGVTVQDARGELVYANDVAARMSGFASADQMLARTPGGVVSRFQLAAEDGGPFSPDDLPGRRLLRGEPASEIVVQFRDLETGRARWSILDATAVNDADGRLQLVVNIFRDITDRKRQSDAMAFLAAASDVLTASLDAETVLDRLAQLAASSIADWCLVDLVAEDGKLQRTVVAHANPDQVDLARAAFALDPPGTAGGAVGRVVRSGRAEVVSEWTAEIRDVIAREPDRLRVVEAIGPQSWIVAPLRARGRTVGTITVATTSESGRRFGPGDLQLVENVAARAGLSVDNARLYREAQEQAQHQSVLNAALRETIDERDRALADLQQVLRTRDEFLASASHDLQNPLASIKATAQVLHRRLERPDFDTAQVREGLDRVDAIASRASSLVEELLDLARMQMGRPLDLERDEADLVPLARSVLAELELKSEVHELRLDAEVASLVGSWDARRLARVLANLVDNAVKYSPHGGVVLVRVRRDPDAAVIEVHDEGVGIPEADRARIFERFQRASNVEGRIGGTGIGLASAKQIVESHGGSVHVSSREGDGSTFTVRLPLA